MIKWQGNKGNYKGYKIISKYSNFTKWNMFELYDTNDNYKGSYYALSTVKNAIDREILESFYLTR